MINRHHHSMNHDRISSSELTSSSKINNKRLPSIKNPVTIQTKREKNLSNDAIKVPQAALSPRARDRRKLPPPPSGKSKPFTEIAYFRIKSNPPTRRSHHNSKATTTNKKILHTQSKEKDKEKKKNGEQNLISSFLHLFTAAQPMPSQPPPIPSNEIQCRRQAWIIHPRRSPLSSYLSEKFNIHAANKMSAQPQH